jgi:acyl-CoA thioester hydrolase
MTNAAQVANRLSTPLEGTPAAAWNPDAPIAAPLQLHMPTVLPQWVDYNGHMSESCYILVFGDNSDAFFRFIGIDESFRNSRKQSFYTLETHIHNRQEVAQGEPLRLTLQLLDADEKRLHLFHAMYHAITGKLLATGEQMLVYVDMVAGRSTSMPEHLATRVQAIVAAHGCLPRPAQAGSSIAIRRKP